MYNAVEATQSYPNGFYCPVFTVKYFSKLFNMFQHCLKSTPDKLFWFFETNCESMHCQSYVDKLVRDFPTLWYSSHALGLDAKKMSIINFKN